MSYVTFSCSNNVVFRLTFCCLFEKINLRNMNDQRAERNQCHTSERMEKFKFMLMS